jgi:peptide deformylase
MTVRSILTADNPLLRHKSKKVTRFDAALQSLVKDLFDSLHAVHGLGLAAPQIGVLQRVCVIEIPAETDENDQVIVPGRSYAIVNPEIMRMDAQEEMEEGCLSVPGYRGLVKRATEVTIKGQSVHGKPVRYRGEDTLAQAFQHETDHLDGVLYLDRLESPDKLWRLRPDETEED